MMQKITQKHMGALARHIADVLGDTDTSRAEVVLAAFGLGDGPTYADLAGMSVPVVSEGLKDAGVNVPALRRGTLAALFAHVRPGAATCGVCGRLPLRLEGSTWSAWTAPTCPADSGLYAADVVPVVRGWHDGREYPEGTTHDPHGVPLDSSTIRVERTVAAEVDAALRETGATLLDVLAATVRSGATPAEALTALGAPLARWPSLAALRVFVAQAKGVASRTAGGPTPPPFDEAGDAGPLDARAVREALAEVYPHVSTARMVATDAGLNVSLIDTSGSGASVWFNIVAEAAKVGKVGDLVAHARREYPNSPALRALTAGPARVAWAKLLGEDWRELQAALLSAFPTRGAFAQMVYEGLGVSLDAIAGAGGLNAVAFEVIRYAEARGHTRRLFDAACAENPGNPALRALARRA